ncbi:MAG TPA: glycosyltransferase family 1 protein [Gemmatimonadaceae bacterium]|nr:glycosyltransferase family 1 protein [Gemmatimonadaceae bacterium]
MIEIDLRLALFCDSYLPQLNGVSLLLERLVDAVRDRGGAVRVFTTTDPHATYDPEIRRWPSVPLWLYPEHRLSLPTPASIKRELDAWRPTIVHAASPFGLGLAARRGARSLGIPFVSSYHTSWSAYTKFYGLGFLSNFAWRYLRWFHNSGDRTYAPTEATRQELELHGVRRTAIWSRGVDTARFTPSARSAALRARLGASDNTVVCAYVGRLGAEKGLAIAMEGMHRVVARAGANVVCAIAGDGPYEAECRRLAPPGTIFMGRLSGPELSEFYASADVFIFPSATDTFGNVILEAMASGLPVVGADVGPTRELLSNTRGLTFPQGNAEMFGDQVLSLVLDRARRVVLAREALAFARTRTWDAIFDELFADYARLSGSAPAAVAVA